MKAGIGIAFGLRICTLIALIKSFEQRIDVETTSQYQPVHNFTLQYQVLSPYLLVISPRFAGNMPLSVGSTNFCT
jgi:hypothetical protein